MPDPTVYDQVAYPGRHYPQSHPDRLATLARLFGMTPADPAHCRVLELGCGDGGNLIPIAYAMPGSQYLGVDLESGAVGRGRRAVQALGLPNIELRVADLSRLPGDLGEFDFVIAHGVYSWVPADVRGALLDACSRHLAPHGVAYVSYNVYPGGHLRMMLRGMLLMHIEEIDDLGRRRAAAREFLDFVANVDADRPDDTGRRALASEARRLAKASEWSLVHDDLSTEFHLCYFRDFCAEADARGLQFLAEADFSEMLADSFPEETKERLAAFGPDLVSREQYLDFLKARRFRQTLLCKAERDLSSELRGDSLWGLAVSALAQPDGSQVDPLGDDEQRYRGGGGAVFSSRHPVVKVALEVLRHEWPKSIPLAGLMDAWTARSGRSAGADDRTLLASFAASCFATGVIELHMRQAPFARWPGPRPRSSALARLDAKTGDSVTNLLGWRVNLDDPAARLLLDLLDGTRDRAALLREIGGVAAAGDALAAASGGRCDEAALAEALERSLETLGRCALLHADFPE